MPRTLRKVTVIARSGRRVKLSEQCLASLRTRITGSLSIPEPGGSPPKRAILPSATLPTHPKETDTAEERVANEAKEEIKVRKEEIKARKEAKEAK